MRIWCHLHGVGQLGHRTGVSSKAWAASAGALIRPFWLWVGSYPIGVELRALRRPTGALGVRERLLTSALRQLELLGLVPRRSSVWPVGLSGNAVLRRYSRDERATVSTYPSAGSGRRPLDDLPRTDVFVSPGDGDAPFNARWG